MISYDTIVVGAGPAGSSCARDLVQAGQRVAIFDRAVFPRDKLCAGWLSPPIWDALELSPQAYPHGLWSWNRYRVVHHGRQYTLRGRGYFIRRREFDHFLLRRTGATVVEGHRVKQLGRDQAGWWVVGEAFRSRSLVGAGGSHCPVARALFPPKPDAAAVTQELEFQAPAPSIAARRAGEDGEPELLLHDDLDGYSWNVPKTDWVNVGCGTLDPARLRSAWHDAQAFFDNSGHLPPRPAGKLGKARGHAYHLFHRAHLDECQRDGAYLVGDALGLAHPFTAEGILPAVLSGRLCAQAILAAEPGRYGRLLASHPLFAEHAVLADLLAAMRALRSLRWTVARRVGRGRALELGPAAQAARALVVHAFGRSFSGHPLPGSATIAALSQRWRSSPGGRKC